MKHLTYIFLLILFLSCSDSADTIVKYEAINSDYSSIMDVSKETIVHDSFPDYYKPFPVLGRQIVDIRENNKTYGVQRHDSMIVRYGINEDDIFYPNPEIEPENYLEVTKILKNVPTAKVHHYMWDTYNIDVWYVKVDGKLIPLKGVIYRSR